MKELEACYSLDGGRSYIFLLKTTTDDQTTNTWAWLALYDKNEGEQIDLEYYPYNQKELKTVQWKDKAYPILKVKNQSVFTNETWITINWYLRDDQKKITHIQIGGRWIEHGKWTNEITVLVYDLKKKNTKSYSNSNSLKYSDSLPKQEINTDDKNIKVRPNREDNALVVKGALNEKIQVYTTTGKLVKSIRAANELVKLELSVKQVYIINIGQMSYKIAF